MNTLEFLVIVGGVLHFGTLTAGAAVPFVLDFKSELAKVDPLIRQLVWVYATYIFLAILSFGALSVCFSGPLVEGTLLARVICGYIAAFWAIRLVIQLFIFDSKRHLSNWALKLGYNGLTVVFTFHAIVYGTVALLPPTT